MIIKAGMAISSSAVVVLRIALLSGVLDYWHMAEGTSLRHECIHDKVLDLIFMYTSELELVWVTFVRRDPRFTAACVQVVLTLKYTSIRMTCKSELHFSGNPRTVLGYCCVVFCVMWMWQSLCCWKGFPIHCFIPTTKALFIIAWGNTVAHIHGCGGGDRW